MRLLLSKPATLKSLLSSEKLSNRSSILRACCRFVEFFFSAMNSDQHKHCSRSFIEEYYLSLVA